MLQIRHKTSIWLAHTLFISFWRKNYTYCQ